MGDRRAERPVPGALGINMDILVVAGAGGKLVDPLLRYRDPWRGADLLPDESLVVGARDVIG